MHCALHKECGDTCIYSCTLSAFFLSSNRKKCSFSRGLVVSSCRWSFNGGGHIVFGGDFFLEVMGGFFPVSVFCVGMGSGCKYVIMWSLFLLRN